MSDPILVVGAGPVGLVAAARLARCGADVRIVDSLAQPSRLSKAVAVHSRTMEQLRAMGLAEAFEGAGVRTPSVSILAGTKAVAEVGFDDVETSFPYMVCLPQDETEAILTAHLREIGVSLKRGV
jgi:2-polyprenyl-6-methoxyphenol hydroxylase-like FAD-dependent oxidoreductase